MALCHDVTDDLQEPVPFGPQGRYQTYTEMIEAMDLRVGRIVNALERLGMRERTVILFTGDNGTSKSYIHSAQDGQMIRRPVYSKIDGRSVRGGKGELTNAGTNVPLIASWQGTIARGQVIDDLVDFSDFLPTLADLAQAKLPAGFRTDGQSFASRIRGESASSRQGAFSEHRGKSWVRTQRWKLYDGGRLFDLANDPEEKTVVSTVKELPMAKAARKKLQRALASLTGKVP